MNSVPLTNYISMGSLQHGGSLLCEAIAEGPIGREPLVDSHKVVRRALMALQIGVSLGANGSYFPIILRAGTAYAVGNGLSFFALDVWAVKGTLNDALGPRGAREIELLSRNSMSGCYRGLLVTSALGLSLLAVTPNALPVLDYDGKFGVLGMIAIYLGGSILPLRSTQLSLTNGIQGLTCVLGDVGKKIAAVRREVNSLVDEYKGVFEQLGMDEKLFLIRSHDAIRQLDEDGRVGPYLSMILGGAVKREPTVAPSLCQRSISFGAHLPGLFLASSLETALAMYTYSKTREKITDDEVGAALFTAVTIGSVIYLNGKSIVSTTHRFACAFFNGLRCKRVRGISDQLRPKISACLKFIGLSLNLGTIGSTLVVFGDFFKDNQSEKIFFEVTMSAAFFFLTATATLDLVEEVVQEIVLSNGEASERDIILLGQELDRLKRLFEKSSLLDFSTFILQCPDAIKTSLLSKVNLSVDTLNEYIAERGS